VPALAFSLISLALYSRGLRGGSLVAWSAGAVVALLAVSTRQNTIVVPLAAGLLLIRRRELRLKPLWVAGILLPLQVGIMVDGWFSGRDDVQRLPPMLPSLDTLPYLFFAVIHVLGLSAVPLLAGRPIRAWRTFLVLFTVLGSFAALLAILHARPHDGLFPYMGNWATPWGPLGNNLVAGDRPLLMGRGIQGALTVLGCIAGAALAACLIEAGRQSWLARPLPLFTVLNALLLLIAPTVYDRYLIVLLPGALALVAAGPVGRFRGRAEVALLCVMGALSFGLLHDFFSWNAARWALGRRAVADGIDPRDIEGGFEWDGWHSEGAAVQDKPRPPLGLTLPIPRRFFDHLTGRYALSFTPLPRTRTLDAEPYRLWLIPGEHYFYLIEQEPEPSKAKEGH
jgi:hypothetical protein